MQLPDRKILLLAILILALSLRAFMLVGGQFIDTQTMAAVLTMKQTIANGYTIPDDPLAGFPTHPYRFSEQGIIYLAALPYGLLSFLGLFGVMYLIKALFVMLAVLVVYLFAKKVTGNFEAGLVAALLYAVSQSGVVTEAFSRWEGDAFVPPLLLLSVLAVLYLLETRKGENSRRVLLLALFVAPLILSAALWNGGVYAYAAFAFAAVAVCLTYFLKSFKAVVAILLILVAVGWAMLLGTQLFAGVNLNGQSNLAHAEFRSSLVQLLGQFQLLESGTGPLYGFLLYPAWLLTGFLAYFGLAVLTIFKFRFSNHSHAETRAYMACLALLLFGLPFAIVTPRYSSLTFMPVAVLAGCSIALVSHVGRRRLMIMLSLLVTLIIAFTVIQALTVPSYEEMVRQFHNQLIWVSQNTPKDATFVNVAGDGIAIQYWADRTTYIDSNLADNALEIMNFSDFLYARAGNFSYLLRVRPDYVLLHDIPNDSDFNGSNVQYLIEWAFNPHPSFSYDGVNFTLVYANFSLISQENRTLIYRTSYKT